jgi:hypothetical protein
MGDRITIIIHLPAALDDINRVLLAVAEGWPTAKLDTSNEEGWRIEAGEVADGR